MKIVFPFLAVFSFTVGVEGGCSSGYNYEPVYQDSLDRIKMQRLSEYDILKITPRITAISPIYTSDLMDIFVFRALNNIRNREFFNWYNSTDVKFVIYYDGQTSIVQVLNGEEVKITSDDISTFLHNKFMEKLKIPMKKRSQVFPLQRIDMKSAELFVEKHFPQAREVLKAQLTELDRNSVKEFDLKAFKETEKQMDNVMRDVYNAIHDALTYSIEEYTAEKSIKKKN